MRGTSRALAAAAALAGCTSTAFQEASLAPGDVVIAVRGFGDPDLEDVRVVPVEAPGFAEIVLDGFDAAVLATLRAEEFLDVGGARVDLTALAVDLSGDRPGSGCTAPVLGALPQVVGAGDRCALPGPIPLVTVPAARDAALDGAIRARLRLVWPGAAPACADFSREVDVAVCPLGEGAARQDPDYAVVAADGTAFTATRGLLVERRGAVAREVELVPAFVSLSSLVPLSTGLLLSGTLAGEVGTVHEDTRWLARGADRAVRAPGYPDAYLASLLFAGAREDEVWVLGRVRVDSDRRPRVSRCTVGPTGAGTCAEVSLPAGPDCRQHDTKFPLRELGVLDGGDVVMANDEGALALVARGAARAACLPGTARPPLVLPSGARVTEVSRARLATRAGRRVVLCLDQPGDPGGFAVVLTATVAALDGGWTPPSWRVLHAVEAPLARCRAVLRDGARDDVAYASVLTPDREVTLRIEGGVVVRTYEGLTGPGGLFPEIGSPAQQLQVSAAGFALVTESGELWTRVGDGPIERRIEAVSASAAAGVRATARGFEVAAGDGRAVAVSPGPAGCDVTVEVWPPGAPAEDVDAVATLGGTPVEVRRRGEASALVVGDVSLRLDGPARVRRLAEVVPGRWLALVRDDGSLWASDGASVSLLSEGDWTDLSGGGGIGWAMGRTRLARLTAGSAGALRVEADVLERIDRAAFDALPRLRTPTPDVVDALACGRALVGFDEGFADPWTYASDTSLWVVEASGAGLRLTAYPPYDLASPQALASPENLSWVVGPPDVRVLVSGDQDGRSAGVRAPGASLAALPFSNPRGFAVRGDDVLVGGPGRRLALLRLRTR